MNMTENGVITADHASQQGHWYKPDGTPAYTIIGKNGAERNTTLRDARKEGFLPSVTAIIRCAAAPGLELWKSQQVLMAALTTDRLPEETEQQYINRIITDSQEQAKKARERGTLIHAWVQSFFEGQTICAEGTPYCLSANDTLHNECEEQNWICEKSFAFNGYGGKADLHTDKYLIDIKTTDKDLTDIKTWEEHAMQLAAYDRGIPTLTFPPGRKCGILYINYKAESKLLWISEEEIEKGGKCFNALLDFYYAKTGLGKEK